MLSQEEQDTPIQIGAGSFASIYLRLGTRIVYKIVHDTAHASILIAEYETLLVIYDTCNDDSFFQLPRPYAFYNPLTKVFFSNGKSASGHSRSSTRSVDMSPEAFTLLPRIPSYAMERVFKLPVQVGLECRRMFYPEAQKATAALPVLCRLYFGKKLSQSRFINPKNFLLDQDRYKFLAEAFGFDPPEEVAKGMGEILARLHWRAGYDGRDIEMVLGGDGSSGITFYTIDFNQMRLFERTPASIPQLVEAHTINDPYYPPARPSDPLYQSFRDGYLSQCNGQYGNCGLLFLNALETKERERSQV